MMLSVFGIEYVHSLPWADVVVWLSVVGIIGGSVMALSEPDLKRMLTWLIVAEVGYMVGGAWLANENGMIGTIYHVISDSAMTSCLFLAVTILVAKSGSSKIESLTGAFQKHPLTMAAFVVGAFSMIGIPPTAGFFSKYYLIRGGLESGHYAYVIALLTSSLVNAVLFFRIIEVAFFGKLSDDDQGHHDHHEAVARDEAPWFKLAPLVFMAGCVVAVGLYNAELADLIGRGLEQIGGWR